MPPLRSRAAADAAAGGNAERDTLGVETPCAISIVAMAFPTRRRTRGAYDLGDLTRADTVVNARASSALIGG